MTYAIVMLFIPVLLIVLIQKLDTKEKTLQNSSQYKNKEVKRIEAQMDIVKTFQRFGFEFDKEEIRTMHLKHLMANFWDRARNNF